MTRTTTSRDNHPRPRLRYVILTDISFGSALKLHAFAGLSLGVVLGLTALVASFLGANVEATLNDTQLTGSSAGVAWLICCPPLMALAAAIGGTANYVAVRWLLRGLRGIAVSLEITQP